LWYAIILIAIVTLSQLMLPHQSTVKKVDQSTVLSYVEENIVAKIAIMEDKLIGLFVKDETNIAEESFPEKAYDFEATIDRDSFLVSVRQIYAERLGKPVESVGTQDFAFTVQYLPRPVTPWYMELIPFLLMAGLMVVFWLFVMRSQGGGNSKVMNFGQQGAHVRSGKEQDHLR